MKNTKRLLALGLAIIMLILPLTALAGSEGMAIKQASSSVKMTSKPGSGSTVLSLKSGDVVFAGEVSGKYTLCLSANKQGYVETKKLKNVSSSAKGNGVAITQKDAPLFSDPSAQRKVLANAKAGAVFSILCESDDYIALRQGSTIGVIERSALTVYNSSSEAQAYALSKKSGSIVSDASKSSKKLVSVSSNELVEVIAKLSNSTSAVKKGSTVGLMNMSNSVIFERNDAQPASLSASESVYSGASTKLKKLGSLKKGESVNKLGEYSSYTIIEFDDGVGCVASKSVTSAAAQSSAAQSADTETKTTVSGAISSEYIIILRDNVPVRTKASSSGSVIGYLNSSTTMKNLGSDKNGSWVAVNYGGYTGYVEGAYVGESSFTSPALSSYDSDALGLIDEINAYRRANGVAQLSVNPLLMKAAAVRCAEIVKLFSHTRPNGQNCNTVDPANVWGENIAKGGPLNKASLAADAFMGSPEHKENALRTTFKSTGTCAMKVGNVYYWVQLFGY